MRRVSVVVCLWLAGLAGVATSGCGGSAAVTGADDPVPVARGSSVLHGAVVAPGIGGVATAPAPSAQSGGSGWVVSVAGTSLSTELDADGRFVLTLVPSGSVTIRIEGPGVSAQLAVSGLVDGQVTSVEIRVTGGGAELASAPKCTASAETFFSGSLDQAVGQQLVVAGRSVDASQVKVVWRGARRIQLSDLELGEKVKVWGVLRGDGIVVAEEVQALTSGLQTWVAFSGRVDHVGSGFLSRDDVTANPYPTPTPYPVIVVKGITVKTSADTKVRLGSGGELAACDIKVGQTAAVEGWKKPDGLVYAARIVINP
jgi:hypothetical protein